MPLYQSLNQAVLSEITAIVGHENVLSGARISDEYTHDAWLPEGTPHYPEAVVFPADAREVSLLVQLANRNLIPVTPRGAGTGLSGGTVPVYGGMILDLSRMNRIIKVDPQARYIIVEPGVPTLDIQKEAARHNLLYAGDPSSDDCVIGGNVATNAGGNCAVKYGVTADQVYELEVVTPQGEIVSLGGRLKKNSTGYGLVKLIIGSEGTLGIVTRITLKLQRLAPVIANYIALFASFPAAAAAVKAILDDALLDPISLEIIDQKTVAALGRYRDDWRFADRIGDCLIIQLEAADQKRLNEKQTRLQNICAAKGGVYAPVKGEKIWQARREFGKAIQAESPVIGIEDIVVPVEELAAFAGQLYKMIGAVDFDVRIAGHAGDGNIHIQILPGAAPESEWAERLDRLKRDLYSDVYRRGGRISGEHGIGLKRKKYFLDYVNPLELELMRAIKKAFDPHVILNPGKIFDME